MFTGSSDDPKYRQNQNDYVRDFLKNRKGHRNGRRVKRISKLTDDTDSKSKSIDITSEKLQNGVKCIIPNMKPVILPPTRGLLDKLNTQIRKLQRELMVQFERHGYPDEPAKNAAYFLAREKVYAECREAWKTIPTYKKERANAKILKQKYTAKDHFDIHWKGYVEANFAFQHMINLYDPTLISDLRNFCKRHGLDFKDSKVWVPNKKEYIDALAANPNVLLGTNTVNIKAALRAREIRREQSANPK